MPEPSTKRHALSQIFRRLRPSIPRTVFTAVVLLIAGVLEGATVGLLVPLLAVLTSSDSTGAPLAILGRWLPWVAPEHRVMALVLGIGTTAIVKNAFQVLGNYSSSALRSDMVLELRRQLLERVLHAGPAALEKHTSGEITDVFVAEAYRVNRFIELCFMLVQRAIMGLAYLTAMLALSWRLTAATMLLGVVIAAVTSRLGRSVLGHGRELSKASSELGRQVTEIVGGLRVIRTTASEPAFEADFSQISRRSARADVGSSLSLSVQLAGIEAAGIAGALGLVVLARQLWLTSGMLDVPHFLAFGFGLVRLLPALNIFYATYGHVTVTVGTVENTLRWLDLPRHPAKPFGDEPVPHLERGIEFRDVSFSYPNGHQPLRSLSFLLPAGQTLAVLGPSGSGKSTLANLLLRLREPSSGVIAFDDTDHWRFSSRDFHRAVGYVDQDSFLFNTSIADNVTCGRPGIERAQIDKALRLVQLGELIDRLPEGIDTVLAERGATLSGGQRQRIAIARAVVTDPQVLVLDEPTSALDLETEEEVMQAVSAASLGRTTLIITHRAAILRHATLRLDLGTGNVTAVLPDAGAAPSALPTGSGASA